MKLRITTRTRAVILQELSSFRRQARDICSEIARLRGRTRQRTVGDSTRDAPTLNTPTQGPTLANPKLSAQSALPRWIVVAGALLGLVLRAFVLRGPLGGLDSDEAVSALVSEEAQHGRFPALIPGLKAGGTLLAYPRAVVLAITGPSAAAAKLCEVAVFAAACAVVWRIGRRLFDERHGQVAALLMWIYPAATIWDSTKVRLYYTIALLAVALGMLVAVRIDSYCTGRQTRGTLADAGQARGEAGDPDDAGDLHVDSKPMFIPPWRDIATFGLIGGVSVWTHPMAMYAFAPTVLWLLARHWRLLLVWRVSAVAGLAAAFGATPWLWHNAHDSWRSLRQPLPSAQSTLMDRFEGFFRALLPRLTGFRHFYNGPWFLNPFSKVLYGVLLISATVTLLRWRGNRTLLLTIAAVYPVLFAMPRNSVFVAEPRYGVPFVPVLALVGAAFVLWISRRHDVLVAAALVAAALISRGLATTGDRQHRVSGRASHRATPRLNRSRVAGHRQPQHR